MSLNTNQTTDKITPSTGTLDIVGALTVNGSPVGGGSTPSIASVRLATIATGTLASSFANGQVIDGTTLVTGDRILIKDQSTSSENGIYTVNASGAPTRATDFNTAGEFAVGNIVFVTSGNTNASSSWSIIKAPTTLGSDPIEFSLVSGRVAMCTTTFTSSGSLTLPGNVSSISLLVVGAGGSGGSSNITNGWGGGGGGGGGVINAQNIAVPPGSTLYVTIGAGGSGSSNTSGGSSYVELYSSGSGAYLAYASGGGAGKGNASASAGTAATATAGCPHYRAAGGGGGGNTGGPGGSATFSGTGGAATGGRGGGGAATQVSGSTGTTTAAGGIAGPFGCFGGGGGGSPPPNSGRVDAQGEGGKSFYGGPFTIAPANTAGGNGGDSYGPGGNGGATDTAGSNATAAGAGGGGAGANPVTTGKIGGNGGPGVVVIKYNVFQ